MARAERPMVVLVVEDEPVNRALVRAVLGSATSAALSGVVLHEAATLAEARRVVPEHRPDVVILDVRLPDGNGLELARELNDAARDGGTRPRILVMSASVLATDQDAARRSGGDAFLGKPFMPQELVELLESLAPSAAG